MKLHYKGKYDLNPESLPHGEHKPGAVKFKEAENSKQMAIIGNVLAVVLMIVFAIPAVVRARAYIGDYGFQISLGFLASLVTLFPHEILHAICFKEDVYLYTNMKQGMLFVVGPESMSKGRFIFMSMLPNLVFGFLPYCIGMIFTQMGFFLALGCMAIGMGAGDYYNVFNALRQMPKGAKTYLYQFNSYWYMPEDEK